MAKVDLNKEAKKAQKELDEHKKQIQPAMNRADKLKAEAKSVLKAAKELERLLNQT